ncbi:acyl carrier protein [Nocardia sp. NPDC059177]|uniref:acyl carrier protein n=1 Tax=Nocardia sp. NPDC059177 TaxID=3346759 RepID=UPI0036CD8F97
MPTDLSIAVIETHLEELRELVANVLDVDPEEVTETTSFVEDLEADSLQAIEILARVEKTYKVEVPQSRLAEMANLADVYRVVSEYTGWGK